VSAWYNSISKTSKKRLQVAQNKVIRFVLDKNNRYHVGYLEFNELNWLPVPLRVKQLQLTHMFKIKNNTAPSYLTENFKLASEVHKYKTRSSVENYFVPQVNTYGKTSFQYTGIISWNSLPSCIKTINLLENFKGAVRKYLFENCKVMFK
jgi:hypothetical protein